MILEQQIATYIDSLAPAASLDEIFATDPQESPGHVEPAGPGVAHRNGAVVDLREPQRRSRKSFPAWAGAAAAAALLIAATSYGLTQRVGDPNPTNVSSDQPGIEPTVADETPAVAQEEADFSTFIEGLPPQLLATSDGFIALGGTADGTTIARQSVDGEVWVDAPISGLTGELVEVRKSGELYTAITVPHETQGLSGTDAFVSRDGRNWTAIEVPATKVDERWVIDHGVSNVVELSDGRYLVTAWEELRHDASADGIDPSDICGIDTDSLTYYNVVLCDGRVIDVPMPQGVIVQPGTSLWMLNADGAGASKVNDLGDTSDLPAILATANDVVVAWYHDDYPAGTVARTSNGESWDIVEVAGIEPWMNTGGSTHGDTVAGPNWITAGPDIDVSTDGARTWSSALPIAGADPSGEVGVTAVGPAGILVAVSDPGEILPQEDGSLYEQDGYTLDVNSEDAVDRWVLWGPDGSELLQGQFEFGELAGDGVEILDDMDTPWVLRFFDPTTGTEYATFNYDDVLNGLYPIPESEGGSIFFSPDNGQNWEEVASYTGIFPSLVVGDDEGLFATGGNVEPTRIDLSE